MVQLIEPGHLRRETNNWMIMGIIQDVKAKKRKVFETIEPRLENLKTDLTEMLIGNY
jgi:hypothetical protein